MNDEKSIKRKSRRDRVLTLLAWVLIAGGLAFIGWKMFGYARSSGRYDKLRAAYAPAADTAAQSTALAADSGAEAASPVDFAALRADCPKAVAWLVIDDIHLSYPVVQGDDDTYFLHHAADGTYDVAGAIFMEAANAGFQDPHVLIFGHHMQDGSMFGRLYEYRDEDFFRSGSGTFTLYTPDGTQQYQIFSVQVVEATDPVFTVGFSAGSSTFDAFVQDMRAGSLYDTGVAVSGTDQVVSLSTCATASGVGRIVISGKRVS